MTEKSLDRYFAKRLPKGVVHIKLSTLGRYGTAGWPDRLLLLPGGRCVFVELKAPGKTLTALQERKRTLLGLMGFDYRIVDSVDAAQRVLAVIARRK